MNVIFNGTRGKQKVLKNAKIILDCLFKDFFLVSLINCIFVKFKVLGMVKMNLKNVVLLMGGAFLIILILAFLGVDMSKPVPYGGVIYVVL